MINEGKFCMDFLIKIKDEVMKYAETISQILNLQHQDLKLSLIHI